jgi:glycerol-3-phosphate cytidylyltransferase-like family protein
MKQLVIMPGGFHPFHAGHKALYDAARAAFPNAEVYVAATNDTSSRPFPFAVKEKLARLAGVEPNHFVQVKSPFQVKEITQQYDPRDTVLIFVRSEKDREKPPQPGGVKRDGTAAYLQPLGDDLKPMSQHGYMTYLPTVEFGPGLTSATEIRTAWPGLTDRRKTALVMSLYPRTQNNIKLAQNVVKMLDQAIVGSVEENQGWAAAYNEQAGQMAGTPASGLVASYQQRENQPMDEDYIDERSWSAKYKRSINCDRPRGFSQKAHCAGRKK